MTAPTAGEQLALLDASEPRHAPSTTELRLITLNIQHSAPARARAQVAWLADQREADALVLTEVGVGPGADALLQALTDRGYESVLAPPSGGDYRTVLASRAPGMEAHDAPVSIMPHRAPAARFRIGETSLGVVGLYVPSRGPRERRNEDKRAFQNAVARELPMLVKSLEGPVIVAGDLNVIEPGHVPHYRVFGEWEFEFYRSFAAAGLIDAYRLQHPATVEHSWFGRGGNGYRFDHCFITADHRAQLVSCAYWHEPRLSGLTDHSAMVLNVRLG